MVQSIVIAFFGGITNVVLQLMELAKVHKSRRPDFRHDFLIWIPYICWPILGALLGYLYSASGIELKPIIAFQIGLSAPMIIRSLAAANPFGKGPIDPGEGA